METLKSYKNIPTQRILARKLGVTESYISMLLSGKRTNQEMLSKLKELIKNSVR